MAYGIRSSQVEPLFDLCGAIWARESDIQTELAITPSSVSTWLWSVRAYHTGRDSGWGHDHECAKVAWICKWGAKGVEDVLRRQRGTPSIYFDLILIAHTRIQLELAHEDLDRDGLLAAVREELADILIDD